MISKERADEIFIIRDFSMLIDIARLIDAINKNEICFNLDKMDINLLLTFTRADGIDEKYLDKMSAKRRDEPIIITNFYNENRIIDGNHRLIKRYQDGYSNCRVISITLDILEMFIEQS